jgi:hypothetical protein
VVKFCQRQTQKKKQTKYPFRTRALRFLCCIPSQLCFEPLTRTSIPMVLLTIRQLDGTVFTANVGADITVLELLRLIAAATDEPVEVLRLVYGGQLLAGSVRLSEQAICDSTALTLLKEGGAAVKAPARPVGVPTTPDTGRQSQPPIAPSSSKFAPSSSLDAAARSRRLPDSVSMLWLDGSVHTIPVPQNTGATGIQLKAAAAGVVGVAAASFISLLYNGASLSDDQLIAVRTALPSTAHVWYASTPLSTCLMISFAGLSSFPS